MADFIRRFVSGNKARFRDEELDLELDLAYITDRVIVMGYPSKGLEGFYRNRREDAKKFLEHRHGKNFWVFNFCPVKENSYPAEFFDGRVSRYPFPDHHSPPLAIMALVAREMRAWLEGSPERVAVLHCKAGKGRSGTMACSYLLTVSDVPKSATIQPSRTAQDNAKQRAEDLMNIMPADVDATAHDESPAYTSPGVSGDPIKHEITRAESTPIDSKAQSTEDVTSSVSQTKSANTLQNVLDLHTAGRMKRPSSPSVTVKPGVSIPSQRRWLYYWSLLLARQGPPGLWSLDPAERMPAPKVRLTYVKLRMRELSALKANLLKAANAFIDKTGKGKAREVTRGSSSHVWVSLARYDDELVETLEKWERLTRSDGDMGQRKEGSDHQDDGDLSQLFADAKWDKGKMVRSFARLGTAGDEAIHKEDLGEEGKVNTYTLTPLSEEKWELIKTQIEQQDGQQVAKEIPVEAEEASLRDATSNLGPDSASGVILDANREVRAKLYIGQVFIGWFWFVPTFHMAHPRASGGGGITLRLTRKELDFPLGIGSKIIDVEVGMEWCSKPSDVISPADRQGSLDSQEGEGDPPGLATAIQAAVSGQVNEALEASVAGED